MSILFSLTNEEKDCLSRIACDAIDFGLSGTAYTPTPALTEGAVHQELGCFVTLNYKKQLRGCIGNLIGQGPLFQTVANMAQAAAFQDPRFSPLQAQEWENTEVEISVLGPITPCPDVSRIVIGTHGLLLRHGRHSGVFLPKVPVEQGWDLPAYLDNLCRKAGLEAGRWKDAQAQLYWYEALVFPVVRT